MDLTGSQVLVSSAGVSPREPRGSQLKFFVSGVLLLTVRSPGSVDFRILSGWRGDMVSQQVWSKRCRFYTFSDKKGFETVAMPYCQRSREYC